MMNANKHARANVRGVVGAERDEMGWDGMGWELCNLGSHFFGEGGGVVFEKRCRCKDLEKETQRNPPSLILSAREG